MDSSPIRTGRSTVRKPRHVILSDSDEDASHVLPHAKPPSPSHLAIKSPATAPSSQPQHDTRACPDQGRAQQGAGGLQGFGSPLQGERLCSHMQGGMEELPSLPHAGARMQQQGPGKDSCAASLAAAMQGLALVSSGPEPAIFLAETSPSFAATPFPPHAHDHATTAAWAQTPCFPTATAAAEEDSNAPLTFLRPRSHPAPVPAWGPTSPPHATATPPAASPEPDTSGEEFFTPDEEAGIGGGEATGLRGSAAGVGYGSSSGVSSEDRVLTFARSVRRPGRASALEEEGGSSSDGAEGAAGACRGTLPGGGVSLDLLAATPLMFEPSNSSHGGTAGLGRGAATAGSSGSSSSSSGAEGGALTFTRSVRNARGKARVVLDDEDGENAGAVPQAGQGQQRGGRGQRAAEVSGAALPAAGPRQQLRFDGVGGRSPGAGTVAPAAGTAAMPAGPAGSGAAAGGAGPSGRRVGMGSLLLQAPPQAAPPPPANAPPRRMLPTVYLISSDDDEGCGGQPPMQDLGEGSGRGGKAMDAAPMPGESAAGAVRGALELAVLLNRQCSLTGAEASPEHTSGPGHEGSGGVVPRPRRRRGVGGVGGGAGGLTLPGVVVGSPRGRRRRSPRPCPPPPPVLTIDLALTTSSSEGEASVAGEEQQQPTRGGAPKPVAAATPQPQRQQPLRPPLTLEAPGGSSFSPPSGSPADSQPLTQQLQQLQLVPPRKQRPKATPGTAGVPVAAAAANPHLAFARKRAELMRTLYREWNDLVFGGRLPADLPLVWNTRLLSTAGQVLDDGSRNAEKKAPQERIPTSLELSTKVVDCLERLRCTLAHEMCHVAAWTIDREFHPHHGPAFWRWAGAVTRALPGIQITRLHSFATFAPFRWQCQNTSCGKVYSRHRETIDPFRHMCGVCHGKLAFLGKFDRRGVKVRAAPAAAGDEEGQGAAGGSGRTTAAAAGGGGGATHAYRQFVKQNFASVKSSQPPGTPHGAVMKMLSAQWSTVKTKQAAEREATAAAGKAGTPAVAPPHGTREAKEVQVAPGESVSAAEVLSSGSAKRRGPGRPRGGSSGGGQGGEQAAGASPRLVPRLLERELEARPATLVLGGGVSEGEGGSGTVPASAAGRRRRGCVAGHVGQVGPRADSSSSEQAKRRCSTL